MKNINEVMHKDLFVPQLKEGEVKEFRLIRAGMIDVRTGKPISPEGHTIPGIEMLRYKGEEVRILNITGAKPIVRPGQETIYDPEFEPVRFPSTGSIYCGVDDFNRMAFMLRSVYNRDNKFRGRSRYSPIYYEVDHQRDAQVKVDNFEYRRLAMNIVAEATEKEMFDIAFAMGKEHNVVIDLNAKGAVLKGAIAQIAESHPAEFIMSSTDESAKMRLTVDKAIAETSIMFDPHPEKRIWTWRRAAGEKGPKNIVKIETGNDPVRGLVDFLGEKEGSEHKAEMLTRINKEETYAQA